MSIENDFLPFATGSGANVESQSTWVSDSVVSTGFENGIANPQQVNKALRQATLIANVITQMIVAQTSQPCIDDGTTATLLTNLTGAINALISAALSNALGGGSGGTGYNPNLSSIKLTGFDPTSGIGQVRIEGGGYGIILRDDGTYFRIELTNSGNASGSPNSLLPFGIALSNGAVTIDGTGVGTTFGGSIAAPSASIGGNGSVGGTLTANALTVGGSAGFSASPTAPTPGSGDNSQKLATTNWIQSYFQPLLGFTPVRYGISGFGGHVINLDWDGVSLISQVDSSSAGRIALWSQFGNSLGTNGYQKHPTGLILQWGLRTIGGNGDTVPFNLAFPNQCFAVFSNDTGNPGAPGSTNARVTSCVLSTSAPLTQFNAFAHDPSSSGYPTATTNLSWFAIGY